MPITGPKTVSKDVIDVKKEVQKEITKIENVELKIITPTLPI